MTRNFLTYDDNIESSLYDGHEFEYSYPSSSESDQEEHWDVDADEINDDFTDSTCELATSDSSPNIVSGDSNVLKIFSLFLLLWASFYSVSANALNHLIKFLHFILSVLLPKSSSMASLVSQLPTTLYNLKKSFGLLDDKFEKYVICPKCSSLYQFKECFSATIIGISPKRCSHIRFRNHPHVSKRQPCGHRLIREVVTKTGKKHYPLKCYCYNSITNSLKSILQRKDYLNKCELWRNREIPEGVLADIYDGSVWKSFFVYQGKPFLSEPHNIGLLLNCDWFQPFKHSQYSVGVLYLVILNLPRSIRFKPENIIIAGIIPGPSEPSTHAMNSYLRPLVKELNSLWTEGFTIGHNGTKIYVALLGSVCDIPATHKLGGFVGHMSHNACWKCSKFFPFNDELSRVDFSGIEVGNARTHESHKKNAIETLSTLTPSARNALELTKGSHFTELMLLPYYAYDCVRFAIIDPMHGLYLGSAKRIMQTEWLNLLTKNDLDLIQERIDQCLHSGVIGRIPRKIMSSFASLTADEWKNWTLLFSLISLCDILPLEHLQCWQLFVLACNIYSSSILTLNDIDNAHDLMRRFFTTAEQLYGAKFLTINTHMHLHLQMCYKDYGPAYGYWLFSFERYNHILGKYHTNKLSVEIQLMRRFVNDMNIKSIVNVESDTPLDAEQQAIFEKLLDSNSHGTSTETLYEQNFEISGSLLTHMSISEAEISPSLFYLENSSVKLLSPFTLFSIDTDLLPYLQSSYAKFLPGINILDIPQICKKYKAAYWWSHHLEIEKNRKFPCIKAYWIGSDGDIASDCSNLCAGKIVNFFSQNVLVGDCYKEIIMVQVKWFQEHPNRNRFLSPVEIWYNDLFKPCGPASFMPALPVL